MSMRDLFNSIVALDGNEPGPLTMNGTLIPPYSDRHLCKDGMGRPAVLISVETSASTKPPQVRLTNLSAEHDIECRILNSSKEVSEGRFSLIRCLSGDPSLQEYFLEIIHSIVSTIPMRPTAQDIAHHIDGLSRLFIALQQEKTPILHGLWGELFLIANSRNPIKLLQSWHSDPAERYDFCDGVSRIEVKSTSGPPRDHYFSLEQAYPPDGTITLVASLFVRKAVNGVTLGELWDRARDIAGNNAKLRMRVEMVCMDTLGSSWEQSCEKSFDEELARDSLAYFDIQKIPRVLKNQPIGVSEVKFKSSLDRVTQIDLAVFQKNSNLFVALR